jgi:hypothetical protein
MKGGKRPSSSKQGEKPCKFIKGISPSIVVKQPVPKPSSPTAVPSGNTIATCKLKSNDIIGITRSNIGNHAFLNPLFNYLRTEENEAKDRFSVQYMGFERHPDDTTNYRADTTKGGFTPRYLCLVCIVPEEKAHKNNVVNRQKWAEKIIKLNNCPRLQSDYRFGNNSLYYRGDVTPTNDTALPPLSDFLTLRDTMEVIRIAYKTTTGEKPSIEDILTDDSILGKYYSQELIPRVLTLFGTGADHNNQHNAQDSGHPDLGGVYIEPFDFE